MNYRTDGATEMAWSTFLGHPIALVFSSTTAAFATFELSVSPAAARVQQVMRADGKLQFVIAAPSGTACGTMQDLLPLVPFSTCRATLRRAGEAVSLDDATQQNLIGSCRKRETRHECLQLFLDLPCSLLRNVLHHHDTGRAEAAVESKCIMTGVGVDGMARAQQARLPNDTIVDGTLRPEGLELTDVEVKKPIPEWAALADRLRDGIRLAAALKNLYQILRSRSLVPPLSKWEDAELTQGSGRRSSAFVREGVLPCRRSPLSGQSNAAFQLTTALPHRWTPKTPCPTSTGNPKRDAYQERRCHMKDKRIDRLEIRVPEARVLQRRRKCPFRSLLPSPAHSRERGQCTPATSKKKRPPVSGFCSSSSRGGDHGTKRRHVTLKNFSVFLFFSPRSRLRVLCAFIGATWPKDEDRGRPVDGCIAGRGPARQNVSLVP